MLIRNGLPPLVFRKTTPAGIGRRPWIRRFRPADRRGRSIKQTTGPIGILINQKGFTLFRLSPWGDLGVMKATNAFCRTANGRKRNIFSGSVTLKLQMIAVSLCMRQAADIPVMPTSRATLGLHMLCCFERETIDRGFQSRSSDTGGNRMSPPSGGNVIRPQQNFFKKTSTSWLIKDALFTSCQSY